MNITKTFWCQIDFVPSGNIIHIYNVYFKIKLNDSKRYVRKIKTYFKKHSR